MGAGSKGESERGRGQHAPCPSATAWCRGVKPSPSVGLRGLRFRSSSVVMGTEPTAAARWMGYWPRRSRTRVEAGGLAARRRRATSMFFFEATKWRAVWRRVAVPGECERGGSF